MAFLPVLIACNKSIGSPSNHQSVSHQTSPNITRRACLRQVATLVGIFAINVGFQWSFETKFANAATPAARETIINSVLGAYGLPTLKDTSGFTPLTQQYGRLVVQFLYPSAWVIQRNVAPTSDPSRIPVSNNGASGASDSPLEGRASGLTVGDYRRAEGVSFYVSKIPTAVQSIEQVNVNFIAQLVTPGDATEQSPDVKVIRDVLDHDGFRIVDTLYQSTTFSGYTVERKSRTRATILSDSKLYALNATCSSIRWKKVVKDFDSTLQSFSVFLL